MQSVIHEINIFKVLLKFECIFRLLERMLHLYIQLFECETISHPVYSRYKWNYCNFLLNTYPITTQGKILS